MAELATHRTARADAPASRKDVSPYDFRNPDRLSKEQARALRVTCESFMRSYSTYLSTTLRTIVEMELISIDQMLYSEFAMALSNPGAIYTFSMEESNGRAILEISPALAFYALERLLGGTGKELYKQRELTAIEEHVLEKVILRTLETFSESWREVMPITTHLEGVESNPSFVQVASANETTIAFFYEIRVNEYSFSMSFGFPYVVIEPFLQLVKSVDLEHAKRPLDDRDGAKVRRRVLKTPVPLTVILGRSAITMREFLDLRVGDVIELARSIHEPLEVIVADQTKFHAYPGLRGRATAVRIDRILTEREGWEDE